MCSSDLRQIANGRDAKVPVENDKPTVVALREIAKGLVTRDILLEPVVEPQEEEEEVDLSPVLPPPAQDEI